MIKKWSAMAGNGPGFGCGQRPDGSPEGNATEDPAAKREPATAKELGLHGRDAYVHGLVTASRRAPAAKPTTGNTSGGK